MSDAALELRRAFDAGFAASPPTPEDRVDLLLIRVGQDSLALRVAELSGVALCPRLEPVPQATPQPGLVGLAGLRGALVPVYALAALLGNAGTCSAGRWLALCGTREPLGLAFDELQGFLRLPRSRLHGEVADTDDGVVPLVDVPLITKEI